MKRTKGIMVAGFYVAAFLFFAWFVVSWANVVRNNMFPGGNVAAWNAFKVLF